MRYGCMTDPLVKRPPARCAKYLAFVREVGKRHGCCVCLGGHDNIHAHHFGPRGIGQKASDFTAVPVCSRCHDRIHSGNMPIGAIAAVIEAITGTQAIILQEWIEMKMLDADSG